MYFEIHLATKSALFKQLRMMKIFNKAHQPLCIFSTSSF